MIFKQAIVFLLMNLLDLQIVTFYFEIIDQEATLRTNLVELAEHILNRCY